MIERFVEHAHERYSIDDLDATEEVRDQIEWPPDGFEGDHDDWKNSDQYMNALCDAYDGLIDREVHWVYGDSHNNDMWHQFFVEQGNKDIEECYGKVYFYKQGFAALVKFIKAHAANEDATEHRINRYLMEALHNHGASIDPWTSKEWGVPPSKVMEPAVRETFIRLGGKTTCLDLNI